MSMKERYQPQWRNEHDTHRIDSAMAEMESMFARELTPDLANRYITSLHKKIGTAGSYTEFVEKGTELHKTLGREIYGPIIIGFIQWAEQRIHDQGVLHGPVHFALRDSWPFYTAAHVLWDGSGSYHALGTYINRPLLGIEDEIAPEHAKVNGYLQEYLESGGFIDHGHPITLIDSGAWGTVVRSIKEQFLPNTPFYPLFWYSHNPSIPGFINEVLSDTSLPEEFGEVINDSLECVFPQAYKRPVRFDGTNANRFLTLEQSDALSVAWGQAALQGVAEAAHHYKTGISKTDVEHAIRRLYDLHLKAKQTNEWTGVLPTHTPTWTKGDEFLAAWPKNLLP